MYPPKPQTQQPPTVNLQQVMPQTPPPPAPPVGDPKPPTPSLPVGATDMGNNLVRLANGQVVDRNHPLFQQAMAPQTPPPGTTGGGVPGVPQTTGQVLNNPVQGGTPTTVTGAFQQALMSRLQQGTPTVNDPRISGAVNANRTAEQRGLRTTREALAERAAATGQSGAHESNIARAIGESAGRQGTFEGQAVMGLAQQEAQELTQALMLGGNLLSEQERIAAQERLAQLQAQLQREGLNVQSSLGGRELDIRRELGMGNLGLGWGNLLQNESQFGRSLGANVGIEQARLNQQALLSLLGGLR